MEMGDVTDMPKVKFVNEKQEIEVPPGSNLRAEARKAGIEIYKGMHRFLNCRGLGLCGTCRVVVKKGLENLSPTTRRERFRRAIGYFAIGHENDMRLACQTQVNGDCEIVTKVDLSGDNFWQKPYPNK
jgi:ferredoxin